MSRSSIDTKLSDEQYQEFLKRAARGTVKDVHAWLASIGCEVSASSVAQKLLSLRPIISPEAVVRERMNLPAPTSHSGRVSGLKTASKHLRAALPYIFDSRLKKRLEEYLQLVQLIGGRGRRQKRR